MKYLYRPKYARNIVFLLIFLQVVFLTLNICRKLRISMISPSQWNISLVVLWMRTIFYLFFYFFLRKILQHKITQTSNYPLLWGFCAQKIIRRKSCLFAFFYAAKSFLKKKQKKEKNRQKIVLLDHIHNTADVYPLQRPYPQLFFTKFSTNFFTTFTYFYLCAPILYVRTSFYLWSSVRIFSFLQESFLIHNHLWKSLLFCGNVSGSFLFVRISSYLRPSVKIF